MKQSKNNSNDDIVSGRLSARPKPAKPGVAPQSSPPSYGANRLGIVSNDDAAQAQPLAQAIPESPAQVPSQPSLTPPAQCLQIGATGVSPVVAASVQAARLPQQPPQNAVHGPSIHKDVASPSGLRPMYSALQPAPLAGPTLPPLSCPHGSLAIPRRETSRQAEAGNPRGRSPLDDLWATSSQTAGDNDLSPAGAEHHANPRHKLVLVGGGAVLLAAIAWACLPSSSKSAYPTPPQAAQASPTQLQPGPQEVRGGAAPAGAGVADTAATSHHPARTDARVGTGADAIPSAPSPVQQREEIQWQPPRDEPQASPPGDANASLTTMPAQDAGPGDPAAGATPPTASQPAKALEPQYRPCPSGIRLTGIVQQAGRKVACINGRFRDVGDTVYGAKVVEIKDLSVEMEQDGQRFLVGFGNPADTPADDDAPADEDKPSDDAPKAAKPDPDTQPAQPPQPPPAKKKHKSAPMDE